jgi:hypothetical protein
MERLESQQRHIVLKLQYAAMNRCEQLIRRNPINVECIRIAKQQLSNRAGSGGVLKCRPAPPRTPSWPFVKD